MKTEPFNFSKKALQDLPAPVDVRQVYIPDAKTRRLSICVTRTGAKSFVFYGRINGKPTRITLGAFPEMTVEAARKKVALITSTEGTNTTQPGIETVPPLTFGELFSSYMDDHAKPHTKGWKDTLANYNLYMRTKWEGVPVLSITRIQVQRWMNDLVTEVQFRHQEPEVQASAKGYHTANRTFDNFRAVIRFGIKMDLVNVQSDPTRGIDKFPVKSRTRYLGETEYEPFLEAVYRESNEIIRDFYLMSLLTGARAANVMSMRFDDIRDGVWFIPDTKNGEAHQVPLVNKALVIINVRRSLHGGEWVFPGEGESGHLVEPKAGWKRIKTDAGLLDLRPHDLRRTVGSLMAASNISIATIAKALGHKSIKSTLVYMRVSNEPVRSALGDVSDTIFGPKEKNTVQEEPTP